MVWGLVLFIFNGLWVGLCGANEGIAPSSPKFLDWLDKPLAQMQCDDLFSEMPSPALERAFGPQIFENEWWPFCSPFILQKAKKSQTDSRYDSILTRYNESIYVADLCRKEDKLNRYNQEYVVPLRAEVISVEKKRTIRELFQAGWARASYSCCKGSQPCMDFFTQAKLRFCGEIKEKAGQEECLRFQASMKHDGISMGNSHPVVKNLYFSFSERYVKDNWKDLEETFVHEFFHVCDEYSLYSLMVLGSDAATTAVYERRKWSSETEKYYRYLFSEAGFSSETYECVNEIIVKGEKPLYPQASPPSVPCENYSYRSNFIEAYADLKTLQNDLYQGNLKALIESCYSPRDSHHPLSRSLLKCALKTPSFMVAMHQVSGCQ